MFEWRGLRVLLLCAVMACPILIQSGCSGGTPADDVISAEDDPTLNPETDSTMNVQ